MHNSPILHAGSFYIPLERRRFLKALALASLGFTLPGYLAEALTLTPEVTEGPYYPLPQNVPLDHDNDLLHLGDHTTAASGIVTCLSGRILDSGGEPIKDALVEIWHADSDGSYIYSDEEARNPDADPGFQGYGQFLTDSTGVYLFRTIKAGLYEGRTRHYHLAVTVPGSKARFCTQTFWNETAYTPSGQAWPMQNSNDNVLQTVDDDAQRDALILDYTPVDGLTGTVGSTFDLAVGRTPLEPSQPQGGSFQVKPREFKSPGGPTHYRVTIPVHAGFAYRIHADPTLAETFWGALPLSLHHTHTADRCHHVAEHDGTLNFYVAKEARRGFYRVSYCPVGEESGLL